MGQALLIRWVSNVVALYVAAWLLSGVTYGDQWWTLLIAAAVFTVVNAWIKPIVAVLSIPFIVDHPRDLLLPHQRPDALRDRLGRPQFEIHTFWWGVLAAIIVSVVNGILQMLLPDPQRA